IDLHAVRLYNHIAKPGPRAATPGQIFLAPGEEIATLSAAISLILLVQEHAVVQRILDRRQTRLDMAPGLLDAPPRDKGGHNVLRRVEEGGVAEAGIGDVGRHRRPADRCRASRRAVYRRRC